MRITFNITTDGRGNCERAGFVLYDVDGSVLVSENSSGRNVAKRSPEAVLSALLEQALNEAASIPDSQLDEEY